VWGWVSGEGRHGFVRWFGGLWLGDGEDGFAGLFEGAAHRLCLASDCRGLRLRNCMSSVTLGGNVGEVGTKCGKSVSGAWAERLSRRLHWCPRDATGPRRWREQGD
jgi:hypothetical protein